MAHLLHLTEINKFHQFYLLGTILAFFAITLSFISHRFILIYNFGGIALALLMDASTAPAQKNVLLAVMVTLAIASYFTFAIKNHLIKSLEAGRERFQEILDRLPVAAIYVSGDFLFMNGNSEKLIGLKSSEFKNAEAWQKFIDSHLESTTLKTQLGDLRSVQCEVYRDDELKIWILLDETEKLAARAKMIQSAKLASLGTMAGGIAHEINNPLTIIKGFAEVLSHKMETATITLEEQQQLAKTIVHTVNRIEAIVQALKKVSHLETESNSQVEIVPISSVFKDISDLCQKSLESRFIKFQVVNPKEEIVIKGHHVDIGQILINLINNSSDAIKKDSAPWIEMGARIDGSQAVIWVRDSGHGIPKEIADKIFEPFYTTKGIGQGTGLGLSISKGLAKENGGDLTYERGSENTCFKLTLPLAEEVIREA